MPDSFAELAQAAKSAQVDALGLAVLAPSTRPTAPTIARFRLAL